MNPTKPFGKVMICVNQHNQETDLRSREGKKQIWDVEEIPERESWQQIKKAMQIVGVAADILY